MLSHGGSAIQNFSLIIGHMINFEYDEHFKNILLNCVV